MRWCDCDFEEGIIHVTHALLYKQGEDGNYRYRVSAPKTAAGFREIPMFEDVKAALQREHEKPHVEEKKFVVDGYSGFIFLNSNGQVYHNPSFTIRFRALLLHIAKRRARRLVKKGETLAFSPR